MTRGADPPNPGLTGAPIQVAKGVEEMKVSSPICNCISCAVIASLLSFFRLSHAQNAHMSPPLQKVADVPMPGSAVRFDYQSMDSGSGRLYIAHMNAGQLVIF